ncbi:MAG: hypothetical protein ACI8WM_003586 [Burkholderiaceae bacterium]|jgi:hypothetical protein
MPKNKKPAPRKSAESPEQKDEALTRQLCALSAYLAGSPAKNATTVQNESDFYKIIKKCLHQKKDDILYEALEWTRHDAVRAYLLLKEAMEQVAEVVVIGRESGAATEVNAFVIPLFLHTTGGLKGAQCFQDQEAYEMLTRSLQEAGLESPDATVVLVNHAYQLDEIDSITFSHLHEMVRDAHASMHDMRAATATAISRSFAEPIDEPFAADDLAVELRFLLGFSMKSVDDKFYQAPAGEADADAWYAARESRFQQWTEQVTPLVRRCFGPVEREVEVHFLYQDLFHGGKERGIAEYFMLQMMSDLNHALSEQGVDVAATRAVVGPTEVGDEKVLRVNLYANSDAALVASSEKPLLQTADLASELADMRDALGMIGIVTIAVAQGFDEEGAPVGVAA